MSREAFARFLRPRVAELLGAIRLDVVYHRARGDRLYYLDEAGQEVEVLDLLGGFGAGLFGHNLPALVEVARRVFDQERPFHAQASARAEAGQLAEALARRLGRATGGDYVVTLANSGTEAIEAAIKHAEMERVETNARELRRLDAQTEELRRRVRFGATRGLQAFHLAASQKLGTPLGASLDQVLGSLRAQRERLDETGPVFLALAGAFHGKTTGSLKLTHNLEFRDPFRRSGVEVRFLPREDLDAAAAAARSLRNEQLELTLSSEGEVQLVATPRTQIAGFLVEPIQGEGGIHVLSRGYLEGLRRLADAEGFPLIIDEIQCGLGRAGTFLASEPAGVRGDYYTFAKALGGGLAKLSALAIDRERYVKEFGRLHTSTYADDDFSSAVGLEVLRQLDLDDERIFRLCRERGDYLLSRLREVAARYPDQVSAVRGRGLMVGIELSSQVKGASPLLRVLSEQDLLGFVISGYLLREHRIRVAPTLSSHGTLRIQPSAFVAEADLDRLCGALEQLAGHLRASDALALCGYIAGRSGDSCASVRPPPGKVAARGARPVAFLGHFLEPGALRDFEPSFRTLSDAECELFLDRTRGVLEPFVVEKSALEAPSGAAVALTVIAVPFTPKQVLASLREGDLDWPLDLVKQGVALAREQGCEVVGFGGYTSIVSDNCRSIGDAGRALTSGNALTAAAALEALFLVARERQIPLSTLGVVGAMGNIGAVMAEVAAEEVAQLLLVGRPGSERRLERAAEALYARLFRARRSGAAPRGVAASIVGVGLTGDEPDLGARLRRSLDESRGDGAPIRISTDLGALRSCGLILSATNSARPVVLPEHVGAQPVVLCDVATPRDVDPAVRRERPAAVVLKGGRVMAPQGQSLALTSMTLEPGQLYGCLAETLLLGLSGAKEHFSYGPLTAEQVRRARQLAAVHGFTVEAVAETGAALRSAPP